MNEFIIECEYDFDEGWIPGEQREEIVRCRDCRHYYDTLCEMSSCWLCDECQQTEPDGFCKWGERREQ